MRIFLLGMGTVLALLSACSPGQDSGSDCKGWDTVAFWQTATVETVAHCLEAGADPNVRQGFDGWTPLHLAARKNLNTAIIAGLVAAGADPKATENSGETPLHKAARNNNSAVIDALLEAGADINAQDLFGETPLHEAAAYTTTLAVIIALLKAGADPSVKSKEDKTPWDHAQHNEAIKNSAPYWRLKDPGL